MAVQANKSGRNFSLDLLRIIAMLMVVIMHLNLFGGFREIHTHDTYEFLITFFDHLSCVAVNVFIIISAWFMRGKTANTKRVVNLVVLIVFWLAVTSTVAYFLGEVITPKDIKYLVPVFGQNYGFCSGYIVMYLLSPYLNRLLDNLEHREQVVLAIGLFFLFSICAPITSTSYLQIGSGYSFVWFVILYIITSAIKDAPPILEKPRYIFISLYFGLLFISTIAQFYSIPIISGTAYNNPLVAISSFSLFLYFLKIDVKSQVCQKIIGILAPYAIAVFLIHANHFIEMRFSSLCFESFIDGNILLYLTIIPGLACVIYLVCSLLDYLRKLFFRLVKIDAVIQKTSDRIDHFKSVLVKKN